MSYKWYALKGYKVWWNNYSIQVPEKHIENLVQENGGEWLEIPNKIEWSIPYTQAILHSKDDITPFYLKCTDGVNSHYFYFTNINATSGFKNKEFYYQMSYELDKYMTIFHNKFELLKQLNPSVRFVRKYVDRMIYDVDEQGVINRVEYNYIKYKPLGQNIVKKEQMVSEYIYGTNESKLWTNNYPTIPLPPEVNVKLWNDDTKTFNVPYEWFTKPNKNNRYSYIVCKSSAKQKAVLPQSGQIAQTFTFATNTKCIIPLFENDQYISNLFNGLLNFSIDVDQPALINGLAADNAIGFFECDIPYSLFYGLSKTNPELCSINFGENKITNDLKYPVVFFEVPINYAPKWKILSSLEYRKGFDGKFKKIITTGYNQWDPETEPYLLNPIYYIETMNLSDGNSITSDISLIDYVIDPAKLDPLGLELFAYFIFDSTLHISYTYDNGTNNYNNTLNPIWNNKESNLQTDISIQTGTYGSSTANYYANNANSAITSISNRKSEQTQSLVDLGFNLAREGINLIPHFTDAFSPVKYGKRVATSALNIAQWPIDLAMEQKRKNASLESEINNIKTAASTIVSNPYIDSCVPNKTLNDVDHLFITKSTTLHPWSVKQVFNDLLLFGYYYNSDDKLATYDNRKYMNILHLDPSFNQDNIISFLLESDKTIYRGLPYNYEFIAWLSTVHRVYKTPKIINVIDYDGDNYIPNIENIIPPLPQLKTDISTIITNHPKITSPQTYKQAIKNMNPQVPASLWDAVSFSQENDTIIIKANPLDPDYYGSVIIFCEAIVNSFRVVLKNGDVLNSYEDPFNDVNVSQFSTIKKPTFQWVGIGSPFNFSDVQKIYISTNSTPDHFLSTSNSMTSIWLNLKTVNLIGTNIIGPSFSYDLGSIANGFNADIYIFDSFEPTLTIENNFLSRQQSFNKPIYFFKNPSGTSNLKKVIIRDNFMSSFGSGIFNSPIYLNLFSIGNSFLHGNNHFNQVLHLENVETIGSSFLNGCTNFNSPIYLSSRIKNIGDNFLENTYKMTSIIYFGYSGIIFSNPSKIMLTTNPNAPCYKEGIKINGAYVTYIKNQLPDLDGPNLYRKIIVFENNENK